MKVKLRITILLLALLLSAVTGIYAQQNNSGDGQNYNTAVGVRLGGLTNGLTVKHFTNPSTALEGIVSFGYRSFVITGLYEKHRDIPSAPGLKWLYGLGGHIGFFRYGGYYYHHDHGHGHGHDHDGHVQKITKSNPDPNQLIPYKRTIYLCTQCNLELNKHKRNESYTKLDG